MGKVQARIAFDLTLPEFVCAVCGVSAWSPSHRALMPKKQRRRPARASRLLKESVSEFWREETPRLWRSIVRARGDLARLLDIRYCGAGTDAIQAVDSFRDVICRRANSAGLPS
jgi:hypothetical protein